MCELPNTPTLTIQEEIFYFWDTESCLQFCKYGEQELEVVQKDGPEDLSNHKTD